VVINRPFCQCSCGWRRLFKHWRPICLHRTLTIKIWFQIAQLIILPLWLIVNGVV